MASTVRVQAPIRQRALFITTLAVPLTGWTVHAVSLHRKLAAARRDPLTGLLGRDGFTAKARQITDRYGDSALVGIVDLDHFKQINDGPGGHAAGDRVLAATAARLTAWAGSRGVVGRLGGDEFAFAVRIGPARRELRLAQLATLLAQPVEVDDGALVDVAASIGAACPAILGTRDLSPLLRAADAAMYAGKHTGRAVLAGPQYATVPSINGRRAGRPGTSTLGRAA
ncbi:GGDEF domain-containing protein [Streptomyces sp. ME02-6987-2C]|uniref:GGDEF domain-containing protein n=1 Tax=unclassified Streptomyces TaxID=2593676 RepID=UPI0029A3AFCC|nr:MULTISPECIES: GGDEF domain-containing protein [unclassified Streptomyces]MDX3370455.1 GGDEF domain-containing protein [Streptomyces sp. ME02-6987-2C]MDX3425998.1 GGDEF domain-containing protein [Streptomyces sp. ME02-6985-2c]